MSVYKRCLAIASLCITIFLVGVFFIASNPNSAHATESELQNNDVLHSATLSYNDETVDLYRNAYIVSIVDQKDLDISFDVDSSAASITLRNITKDGDTKDVCQTTNKSCHIGINDLSQDSGIEISIYNEKNEVIRQTMLGLIVKQDETKESYEDPVSIGPGTGITIDMSSISPGMKFTVNAVTIPVKYEHYSDGRSVLGIGTNSTDESFWEDAAKDNLQDRISRGDLYSKWEQEKEHQTTGGSLGLVWAISGYATAYDNNPSKMTGTLQFYIGSGYSLTGQYAIFTYTVTVTFGADGEFIFTIDPSANPRLSGAFNLGLTAGLELYGGIGSGWLASIGIYGAAKIGAEMAILPQYSLDRLYVSGEVGLKAKVLGRDAFTFTFTSGTKEFIEKDEPDGTVSYTTDLNLKQAAKIARDEVIASNYGQKPAGDIKTPEGETIWHLNNLDMPSSGNNDSQLLGYGGGLGNNLLQNNPLTEQPQQQIRDNRDFAHLIAENVYAHSGTQIIKNYANPLEAIMVFANNDGELYQSIFNYESQQMTTPVAIDGTDYNDFNARLKFDELSTSTLLAWQRYDSFTNGDSLSETAKKGKILYSEYDYDAKSFTDAQIVSENYSDVIYGGIAVAGAPAGYYSNHVYAYSNPEDDPDGISETSTHQIYSFSKENGEWVRRTVGEPQTGIISTFDAGPFSSTGVVVFTITDSEGNQKSKVLENNSGATITEYDNAFGAHFVLDDSKYVLAFIQNGRLYKASDASGTQRVFGTEDHKLPEAEFQIIGDIHDVFMVTFLSSIDSRQNIIGYLKTDSGEIYEPTVITNVNESSNVTYYDGVLLGDNKDPFIVYTNQSYEKKDSEWDEGQADMYALTGEATNHVSILSSDVVNLKDIAVTTNIAEADILVRNTGLYDVHRFSLYVKPTGSHDDKYVKLGDYDTILQPGDMYLLRVQMPEPHYAYDAQSYTVGATSRDDTYSTIGVQTEGLVDVPEGPTRIVSTDYDFRSYPGRDAYTVTIKSLGPVKKNGKIVFYNTETLEVYQENQFKDLMPNDEFSATLSLPSDVLSKNYENLGTRVLNNDETLDNTWPTNKFRKNILLPEWYAPYLNRVGGAKEKSDPLVPNTGFWTRATSAVVASGVMIIIILSASRAYLYTRNKEECKK